MPRYSFACPNGERYEAYAPFEDVWAACPHCGIPGPRDFHADLLSQSVNAGDPWRAYHLSTRKEAAAAEQGRRIGGPQDVFEKRQLEKTFGRQYIGDNLDGLSKKATKAIEKGRRKEFAYQHERGVE